MIFFQKKKILLGNVICFVINNLKTNKIKKLIYGVAFVIATGMLLTNCKKEALNSESVITSSENIASEKGKKGNSNEKSGNSESNGDSEFQLGNEGKYLIFNSEAGYERAVNNPSENVRQNLFARMNAINHQSWREFSKNDGKSSNDEIVPDEYYGQILSKDRTLRIKNHIFKFISQEEGAVAIHVRDKDLYTELISENPNNPKIIHFGPNDEALEIINSLEFKGNRGNNPQPGRYGCGDSGVDGREVSEKQRFLSEVPAADNWVETKLGHFRGLA